MQTEGDQIGPMRMFAFGLSSSHSNFIFACSIISASLGRFVNPAKWAEIQSAAASEEVGQKREELYPLKVKLGTPMGMICL